MASLFADENVRLELVQFLRAFGHDVLTAFDAGRANRQIPDPNVLAHATLLGRAVLTNNRRDFHRLHKQYPQHAGIVTYTYDDDDKALAVRINGRISSATSLAGLLVKVTRGN